MQHAAPIGRGSRQHVAASQQPSFAQQRGPGLPLVLPSSAAAWRARSCRLQLYARRTVSGTDASRTVKGQQKLPTHKPSKGAASSSRHSQLAPKQPPSKPRSSSNSSSSSSRGSTSSRSAGGGSSPQGQTDWETFMRNTPGFNRFLDGILIFGDAVMVAATELSSERVPYEQLPALASVTVLAWVCAGAALGDYMKVADPDANPLSDAMGWPIFVAVANSMVTWAVGLVLSLLGYSWLVSSFIVDPEMVMEVAHDGQLSPQLEVCVALLITMSCWRGTAARLRL